MTRVAKRRVEMRSWFGDLAMVVVVVFGGKKNGKMGMKRIKGGQKWKRVVVGRLDDLIEDSSEWFFCHHIEREIEKRRRKKSPNSFFFFFLK